MLAIIGGPVDRFAPFADLYRRALAEFGATESNPIGYHSYGHVADTDEQAMEELYEPYTAQVARIGAERGRGRCSRTSATSGPSSSITCWRDPGLVASM